MTVYKIIKIDNHFSVETSLLYNNIPNMLNGLFENSPLKWHVASAFLKDYISAQVSYQSGKKFGLVDENGDYYFSGTRESLAIKYHCHIKTLRNVIKTLIQAGLIKIRKFLRKIFIVKTGRVSTVNFFHFCFKSILQKLGLLVPENCATVQEDNSCESVSRSGLDASKVHSTGVALKCHSIIESSSLYLINKSKKENSCAKKQVEQVKENLNNPLKKKVVHSNNTARDMLKIYNEELGESRTMTKNLAQFFVATFKKNFESNLENWRKYCEKFKFSGIADGGLEHALKFKTIDQIIRIIPDNRLNTNNNPSEVYSDQSICEKIDSLAEISRIKEIRKKIAKKIGYDQYFSWFHLAKFYNSDCEINLVAPNRFVEENWETRFSGIVNEINNL